MATLKGKPVVKKGMQYVKVITHARLYCRSLQSEKTVAGL